MRNKAIVLSLITLAACGGAPAPAETAASQGSGTQVFRIHTRINCGLDRISSLWCESVRLMQDNPLSLEAIQAFRDAAVLVAEEPTHPLVCHILFGAQNALYLTLHTDHVSLPSDVASDLSRIEPVLFAACPSEVILQDQRAQDELAAYRENGDVNHVYTANIILISHHPSAATACRAAEATTSAIRTAAENGYRLQIEHLSRDLTELQALCGRAPMSGTLEL